MNLSQSSARPRVLIVDDVQLNLVALEAALAELPCEIFTAASGNEALRQLLRGDVAVMLLDVQMPGMDGYEVARFARANPDTRGVPIIFLTAQHQTADVLRGYGNGAVDYLIKPADVSILRSKVSIFLELYEGRRRLEREIQLRTALAEELRRTNVELAATNAELEAFSYSVSHDLRAPLRAIDGFSAALADDCGTSLDETGKDYLRRVRSSVARMSELIDDLLELSRVTRAELSRQRVDVSACARDLLRELAEREPSRVVEAQVADGLVAEADPGLLRTLLENLLRNAWKFTSRCERALIQVGAHETAESGRPTFFVRDNGAGFDMAYAAKLFRPFQRLHDSQEFEGTGVGLATVQRVVNRHGGRVWAEGAMGQGATFYFTLSSGGAS